MPLAGEPCNLELLSLPFHGLRHSCSPGRLFEEEVLKARSYPAPYVGNARVPWRK